MRYSFQPETRLLLLCARTRITPATKDRLRALIDKEPLDWERAFQLANHHGVLPLVDRALQLLGSPPVPDEVQDQFSAHARSVKFSNMARTGELRRVLALCEDNGIPVMPFKGPTLGKAVYGDVALRQFSDLDVLVRRNDFQRTKALLLDDQYHPGRELSGDEEQHFLDTQMGYEFVRRTPPQTILEVHWAFLNTVHAFRLDPDEVWQRSDEIQLGDRPTPVLCPEDRLLYLCAHGSKSFWRRIIWISDVSETVRTHETLDWNVVLRTARQLHCERMLYLGLFLAHTLLDAPVPPKVEDNFSRDDAITELALRTARHLDAPDANPLTFGDEVQYHLEMRERLADRLPYYGHLAKLATDPTKKDKAFIDLPGHLSFLYYVVRPIRILYAYLAKGAGN